MNGFFGMMLIGLAPWLLFGGGISISDYGTCGGSNVAAQPRMH